MALSSVALLVVFVVLGSVVLLSYGLAVRGQSDENVKKLFAGLDGPAMLPFAVLPPITAVAFLYNTYFWLALPTGASVLGMQWGDGGELLVCLLYAVALVLSACWLPTTFRVLRTPSRCGLAVVIAVLNGVAAAAVALAVAAFALDGLDGSDAAGTKLTVHKVAAVIFAGQTLITDGIFWSFFFYRMVAAELPGASG